MFSVSKRPLAAVAILVLASCGAREVAPVEVGRFSEGGVDVILMAVPDPPVTHGDLIVSKQGHDGELARIRVIEATDYVDDVRERLVAIKSVAPNVVQVCIKGLESSEERDVYAEPKGVKVTVSSCEP